MVSNKDQSTFFCCSPRYKSTMLFGAKQPCRAHAHATIPVMSHALEKSKAFSMALKLISHGAFCGEELSPHKKMAFGETYCGSVPSCLQKALVIRIPSCHAEPIRQPDIICLGDLPNMISLEIAICGDDSSIDPLIRIT